MKARGDIRGCWILAGENVGHLCYTSTHTVTDEDDACSRPTDARVVSQGAEQRLSKIVNAQDTLAPLVPVGLVAEGMDAHMGKLIVSREPGEWPIVCVIGGEGPCLATAPTEAVDEDKVGSRGCWRQRFTKRREAKRPFLVVGEFERRERQRVIGASADDIRLQGLAECAAGKQLDEGFLAWRVRRRRAIISAGTSKSR